MDHNNFHEILHLNEMQNNYVTNNEGLKRMNFKYSEMLNNKVLKLMMKGKAEEKTGIGRKKYSQLKNIRNWIDLDAHFLFRATQDREKFAGIVAKHLLNKYGT